MQVRFDRQLQSVEQNSEDESTVYYFSVLFIDLGCYKVCICVCLQCVTAREKRFCWNI